jgi:hypothetical protein
MSDSAPALSGALSGVSTLARPSVKEVLESLVAKVGEKGDAFPILDRVWDIYAGKGIRTVFLTVGASKAALADLEIAESLGCPLNIVPLSEGERASWTEVFGILKERKREPTASAFSEGAESKWILPKNVRLQEAVPWWENGTIDISGNVLKTQNVGSLMTSVAAAMKLKDNANRIDILKIDTEASAPGLEKALLGAILSAGYRPAIVLVRWNKMPDVDLSTTLAAGHLQNSGYSLVGKVDNKFAYYFTDEDLYQICSWEGITPNNPVMTEIIEAAKTPRFHSSAKTEVV